MKNRLLLCLCLGLIASGVPSPVPASVKTRVLVTSDGEIDDQCSLIRFLLYANEWDIEGIVTSSSQYHWQGHHWAGDDWIEPDLKAYAEVYPNLLLHDPAYPTPEYLRERTLLGNTRTEGEMEEVTAGSELIVKVLLDASDPRPVWLQAWGGTNTIARALKTIEEQHPERMAEVAGKCRFLFIWEQDRTYQDYILPVWGKYEIPTIISDQFEAIAYRWKQAQPPELHRYFEGPWMRENILEGHGPLTAIYAAHANGDFRSEGDSPAFLHTIPTGLRSLESPDWGGWGGRYVRIRENTWLDPVPVPGYSHPSGRWYGNTGWGRNSLRPGSTSTEEQRREYFKPMWRWSAALQNDFAARADWCVMNYEDANHPPVVKLAHAPDITAQPGMAINLSAAGSTDPDGDELNFRWWQYEEAGSEKSRVEIRNADQPNASFIVPANATHARTIHIVCEVTDSGSPAITRYQRVVVTVDNPLRHSGFSLNAAGAAEIPPMSAHFPLDGGQSNRVSEIVNGHSGALHNADPAVAWIPSDLGGALHLDGRDDRAIVPHHPAFDFQDESFTISFWMRWPKDLPIGHERFLTKGDFDPAFPGETGKRYEFYVSSGAFYFVIDDNVTSSRIKVSATPFVSGEWVHVAAVRDRKSKRLKLYADGTLLPTTAPGNPGSDGTDHSGGISNPRPLYIGDSTREDVPYQGDLDDIRFFRHALTDQQIAAIAAKAKLVEVAVVEAASDTKVVAAKASELPPMTAHFPLKEGKGAVINDVVNGTVGTLHNADLTTAWTSSPKGIGLKFDGRDDRLIIPASPAYDFADESFSVSFWMRWPKNLPVHHERIFVKGDFESHVAGETGKRWEMFMPGGGLCWVVDDNLNKSMLRVPLDAFITGEWVHVVAVRDTKDKRLKLYADGVLQKSNAPTDPLYDGVDRTGSISNPRPLYIGDSSREDTSFEGELSDIRIYRSALDAAQVAAVGALKGSAAANPEKPVASPARP